MCEQIWTWLQSHGSLDLHIQSKSIQGFIKLNRASFFVPVGHDDSAIMGIVTAYEPIRVLVCKIELLRMCISATCRVLLPLNFAHTTICRLSRWYTRIFLGSSEILGGRKKLDFGGLLLPLGRKSDHTAPFRWSMGKSLIGNRHFD